MGSLFRRKLSPHIWLLLLLSATIGLTGCIESDQSCPSRIAVDLHDPANFVTNNDLPFRFPLDSYNLTLPMDSAKFATFGYVAPGEREYHAAEDIHLPPGTPVYAIADGKISYSGPMGGYGWLVIIDHPQANLYSLYGHLSPGQWSVNDGDDVRKGDLIAYLGEEHENGGSRKEPLRPHLHFGVRAGQMKDYPGSGEARWMAGWIKPCPQDVGWLQPSKIITEQHIPPGGFELPRMAFLDTWAVDLLLTSFFLIGGIFSFVASVKSGKYYIAAFFGVFVILAVYFMNNKGYYTNLTLSITGILLLLYGFYGFISHYRILLNRQEQTESI